MTEHLEELFFAASTDGTQFLQGLRNSHGYYLNSPGKISQPFADEKILMLVLARMYIDTCEEKFRLWDQRGKFHEIRNADIKNE